MNTRIRYAIALAFSLLGCAGASATGARSASPASGANAADGRVVAAALDGRTYDVTLETPETPALADTLHFVNGKFESTACTTLGFPEWSEYMARADADAIAFHVLAKHPSGTTMDWSGSVKGDAVDGTATRTMNGKTDVLRFKGSLSGR
jgi:hypothetical protein